MIIDIDLMKSIGITVACEEILGFFMTGDGTSNAHR
jgi:hypothetical protein